MENLANGKKEVVGRIRDAVKALEVLMEEAQWLGLRVSIGVDTMAYFEGKPTVSVRVSESVTYLEYDNRLFDGHEVYAPEGKTERELKEDELAAAEERDFVRRVNERVREKIELQERLRQSQEEVEHMFLLQQMG